MKKVFIIFGTFLVGGCAVFFAVAEVWWRLWMPDVIEPGDSVRLAFPAPVITMGSLAAGVVGGIGGGGYAMWRLNRAR